MMVKKYLPLIYILLLCLTTMTGMITPKSSSSASEAQVIPNEAIRLRILANSNKESDQELKRAIRDEVNKEINTWVAELTSIEEARSVIRSHLSDIESIAKEVMVKKNNVQSVNVEFGETIFPTKLYGQYLYPAGKYEAVKITLGEGDGANWWCVLFPPLCFLDFNSGTAVASDSSSNEPVADDEQPTNRSNEETVEQTLVDEAQSDEQKEQPIETASQTNTSALQTENQKPQNTYKNPSESDIEAEQEAPVYEDQDEASVKTKFFLVELVKDLF